MLNSPWGMSASSVMISQEYILEVEHIMLSGQWHCTNASGSSFSTSFSFQTLKNFFSFFSESVKSWLQSIYHILLVHLRMGLSAWKYWHVCLHFSVIQTPICTISWLKKKKKSSGRKSLLGCIRVEASHWLGSMFLLQGGVWGNQTLSLEI